MGHGVPVAAPLWNRSHQFCDAWNVRRCGMAVHLGKLQTISWFRRFWIRSSLSQDHPPQPGDGCGDGDTLHPRSFAAHFFHCGAAVSMGLLAPGDALYPSAFAVFVGLTCDFLPFLALPLYASVEKIDWSIA